MLSAILTRYPVKVLTPAFLIHGQVEPKGTLLNYLNDRDNETVPFYEVTLYDLSGKLKPTPHSMVVIRKVDICGLYLDDAKGRGDIQLLKRAEKVILHLPHLVCRGEIHLGSEARLQDLLDTMIGQFIALTGASVFPTIALPAEFPHQPELLLLHKDAVQAYYPEG